jgi:hypothetical protein
MFVLQEMAVASAPRIEIFEARNNVRGWNDGLVSVNPQEGELFYEIPIASV